MCVCVFASHLFDRVIGADVQCVDDPSGQIEGLVPQRLLLAAPHRHRPPQVHLDFDEAGVDTSGVLLEGRRERAGGSHGVSTDNISMMCTRWMV